MTVLNPPPTPPPPTLTARIAQVAPKVMNWKQCAEAGISYVKRNYLGDKSVPEYRPDFAQCVDHFVIHAGGSVGEEG
jgi:hypothetical protein